MAQCGRAGFWFAKVLIDNSTAAVEGFGEEAAAVFNQKKKRRIVG
jgi:hypothetical protein